MSEMRTYECWVYVCGCRADMVSKPEAEAVFAAQSERYTEATWHGDEHREELWAGVEERCRAMADKFKEVQK